MYKPTPSTTALVALAATLCAAPLAGQTVTFSGQEMQVNASTGAAAPTVSGAALHMSTGQYATASSALTTNTFNLFGAWSTRYRLSFGCQGVPLHPADPQSEEPPAVQCPGDGIAFVATAGGANQLGTGGFDVGYSGSGDFAESVAFGFKTFWGNADLGVNGNWQTDCCELTKVFPDNPAAYADVFDVSLSYDGLGNLTSSIVRVSDNLTVFGQSYAWTAPAWAANARVGFTAATGDWAEQSQVSDWRLTPTAVSTVPEPSTVLLLSAGLAVIVAVRRRRA